MGGIERGVAKPPRGEKKPRGRGKPEVNKWGENCLLKRRGEKGDKTHKKTKPPKKRKCLCTGKRKGEIPVRNPEKPGESPMDDAKKKEKQRNGRNPGRKGQETGRKCRTGEKKKKRAQKSSSIAERNQKGSDRGGCP